MHVSPRWRDTLAAPTILVVDDDAAIRDLLAEVFELAGYRAETAANGAEAGCPLNPVRLSLILLDETMPV